jgi:hypothetical protein
MIDQLNARNEFMYETISVQEMFPNAHAELDYPDSEYKSEWDILDKMFDVDHEKKLEYQLARANIFRDDGLIDTSGNHVIFVLHLPTVGRVAVINNAYTTWADDCGDTLERLIDIYYNEVEEWERRN